MAIEQTLTDRLNGFSQTKLDDSILIRNVSHDRVLFRGSSKPKFDLNSNIVMFRQIYTLIRKTIHNSQDHFM